MEKCKSCNCELTTIYTQFSGLCVECERFEEHTGLSAKAYKPRPSIHFPDIITCQVLDIIYLK